LIGCFRVDANGLVVSDEPEPSAAAHPRAIWLMAYAAALTVAIVSVLVIHSYGSTLSGPATSVESPHAPTDRTASNPLVHILATLSAVMLLGRFLRRVPTALQQPAVIAEGLAGILLGPSLLGVWPAAADRLLPGTVAPVLGTISQVGIILYMFRVGIELDG